MVILTNNLLFNHTYLKELTADTSIDPEIPFSPADLGDWYSGIDTRTTQTLVDSWVQLMLSLLELEIHDLESSDEHTFKLTTAYDHETPVGVCYVAPPGVDLDTTTKGQFWMAQAVLAARRHEPALQWVILTNGDLWRLLDAQTLRRYEAYLQIDLGQLARGASDPSALRVFFRCFYRTAFEIDTDGKTGIGKLMDASDHATEKAEKHLKEWVSGNDGIMAQLCLGLVRSTGKSKFSEAERDAIYQDATTLLYRMLFLLYAESRDLLPIAHPNYAAVSMQRLVEAARDGQIKGLDDPQGITLWAKVKHLSNAIYESDPDLDIPAYNGGLFDDDDHPYLRDGFVSDQYLAHALSDLAYLPNGDGRQRIDYRDLSVRHLGSLYEGMIEYKLFVAEEPMLARRDKKGNVHFQNQVEAGGLRRTDQEIKTGDVYFAQSSGERHATGTYYTPEYIVDYIIQNTVLKGLGECRLQLKGELETWMGEIEVADSQERARLERTVDDALLSFVEEQVLTFTVCDPAMGSGHFLVSAAHNIADFIVETLCLTTWPNQDLNIDPAYWRRLISDRCLYGVDINHMAVELAKLSLWIMGMSKDRPLSFLEHHIRQGNSLLGVQLSDLLMVLEKSTSKNISLKERKARANGQLTMLDDPGFNQNMFTAAHLIENISTRLAHSVNDVKDQERDYELARKELAVYRQLGDVIIAREYGLVVHESIIEDIYKYLLLDVKEGNQEYEALLQEAEKKARDKSYFHWPLEFPEVFLESQSNPLHENKGFDVIVGNPPYIRQEKISEDKTFLKKSFINIYHGTADAYIFFYVLGVRNLAEKGLLGYVSANKWIKSDYARSFRQFLVDKVEPVQLLDFMHSNVFPDTDTFPSILILQNNLSTKGTREEFIYVDVSDQNRNGEHLVSFVPHHSHQIPFSNLFPNGWILETAEISKILESLSSNHSKLGDLEKIKILTGIKTGYNAAFYLDSDKQMELVRNNPNCETLIKKLLRGRNIKRWVPEWDGEWMISIPSSVNKEWPWSYCTNDQAAEEIFGITYPSIYNHLKPFEDSLRRRQDQGKFWWELRSCDYYNHLERPKIVIQQILYHSVFGLDKSSHWVNQKVYFLTSSDLYHLAILNSRVIWWLIYRIWPHMKDEALSVQKQALLSLPIPNIPMDLRLKIESLTAEAIRLSEIKELLPLFEVEAELDELVKDAFGLSTKEVGIIVDSLPPRDPLGVLKSRLNNH